MHAALVLDLLHQHLRLVRRAGDVAVAVGAVGGADRHTEGGAPEGGFLIEIVGAGIDDDGGEATAMHRVTPELSVDSVGVARSEEHTSELQSLMRISYAVFCLKKKKEIQRRIETGEC